jgi:ATP-dependent helicase/nuclease subunit B
LLERSALRGPRPMPPGIGGIRRALDRCPPVAPAALGLLGSIERCLEPLLRLAAAAEAAPRDLLTALLASAEALAATDEVPGANRLWASEDGEVLATVCAEALQCLDILTDQAPRVLPGLLDALLQGAVVRSRRALRGRSGLEHPRVFIWGLLEARLQSVDTVVLGGLVEGVWPPTTDPGPWMSRPMRERVGLASPEERVGQAAHDFFAAASAARTAILSSPKRRDGSPAVPARWLTRLDAYLAGQGRSLPRHPAAQWARAIDQPAGPPRPVAPPRPRPDPALRPRRLSVTEIETWLADPYAIYARHVLRLLPLRPLEQAMDAADYGTLVHAGLHQCLKAHGVNWPDDALEHLCSALRRALVGTELRRSLIAWWVPRLDRIADWVAKTEAARRTAQPLAAIATEVSGTLTLPAAAGPFVLTGRADRIERRADGRVCIIDYKTGSVPTKADIVSGRALQLVLEAVMAQRGAFAEAFMAEPGELAYWKLTGGFESGSMVAVSDITLLSSLCTDTERHLIDLIDRYDDPRRPYLARPDPAAVRPFSDYAQLARVGEWAAAGEEP